MKDINDLMNENQLAWNVVEALVKELGEDGGDFTPLLHAIDKFFEADLALLTGRIKLGMKASTERLH